MKLQPTSNKALRGLTTTPGEPQTYTVAQAAARLGVSPRLLYKEIDAGRFPAIRIGHRIVIARRTVERLVMEVA